MRILKVVLAALAFVAGSAFAAPVVWTIPTTTLSDASSISGTFTYDSATSTLSAVNIVQVGGGGSTFNTPARVSGGYIRAQAGAYAGANLPGIYLDVSAIPAAGGTYTSSVAVGTCLSPAGFTGGICNGVSGPYATANANISAPVVVAASQTVPTLSEYALIALASLMAMGGIWTMRKRGKI